MSKLVIEEHTKIDGLNKKSKNIEKKKEKKDDKDKTGEMNTEKEKDLKTS